MHELYPDQATLSIEIYKVGLTDEFSYLQQQMEYW